MSWCIKHPEYSKENDRINSYIHARTRSFVSECRIELAEAGFFYAGKKDQTICFYCGGGLHHWQDIDDPWEEHAKWFPKCPFVLVHKGQDFVNEMRSRTERNALQKKRIPTNNIAVPPPIEESNIECIICMNKNRNLLFLPCKHCFACDICGWRFDNCCYCRAPIISMIQVFLV
ncbi:baculoviral IAP repeat-containing protein 7-B-like [Macrosteles quadrilineatus]|uniref:baculoviral IAP repeat-containing protein 7-B-like n=1 Tax=Macrosteles quadrilineatus TaxID=74068 RepID=UPI0023E318EF|nr:baculoviral IAP repeat-containing protein 7-B-like [Macrosteles quadrilineatus]XP_054259812.1 baculoviral IAP repeat-containing protein 7-B-like [Macrosteles quadrilineatus]XP_054272842.1 baculoviral IAP repeat-containing protein 7-B-like [Macrosteles quadrilineatus]XP_054281252.1 baculoviral IAP repeat-containing protein 7-B-like [Macrosteles quadrilineatus]XP_054287889.1 baculoviral IAP repeat-containing protein 7-B-like [Macrosteles quadrilineatus]XP_054287978.1 baculoviral IAP repeat-co